MPEPTGEDPMVGAPQEEDPFDKQPFDAGIETSEENEPKKFIQQLSGKLGQSLRKYTQDTGLDLELEKFAINSLLSASHTAEMDQEDKQDIIKRIETSGDEPEEEEGDMAQPDNMDEPSMTGASSPASAPDGGGAPMGENIEILPKEHKQVFKDEKLGVNENTDRTLTLQEIQQMIMKVVKTNPEKFEPAYMLSIKLENDGGPFPPNKIAWLFKEHLGVSLSEYLGNVDRFMGAVGQKQDVEEDVDGFDGGIDGLKSIRDKYSKMPQVSKELNYYLFHCEINNQEPDEESIEMILHKGGAMKSKLDHVYEDDGESQDFMSIDDLEKLSNSISSGISSHEFIGEENDDENLPVNNNKDRFVDDAIQKMMQDYLNRQSGFEESVEPETKPMVKPEVAPVKVPRRSKPWRTTPNPNPTPKGVN